MPQDQSQDQPGTGSKRLYSSALLILAVSAALFAIRLASPPNLLDQDQERPAAYVLDVVQNGNWICQRDHLDDITSKPPLFTWLSAATAILTGRVNEFSLYLPGALAALGTALLIWRAGNKYFGGLAGLFAALASMLTTAGLKEFGLARTDGVFAFTVAATALLAFEAWRRGRGWLWVWLLAAASVLTKGPLGMLMAGGGLLAAAWERRSGNPAPIKGSHWAGVGLFVLICGGWFLLAYRQEGHALVAKMLGKELLAHAVSDGKKHYPGMLFYQPILYYLGRAAPWSLFGLYGFYRLFKQLASEAMERRFERFLFCWFAVGLGILSLAPHQRADLLWPIMPAGALIAGRELNRLTAALPAPKINWGIAIVILVAIGGYGFYYFGPRGREAIQRQSLALRDFAANIGREEGLLITHVDDPMALQIYLNTLRRKVSYERASELLRGSEPAWVAIKDPAKLEAARRTNDPPLHTLMEAPQSLSLKIVSNRPTWELTDTSAFCSGWMRGQVHGGEVAVLREHSVRIKAAKSGDVVITNESDSPQSMTIEVQTPNGVVIDHRTLSPRDLWRLTFDGGTRSR
jgi:4-amino-4-deoxy-L-arabinose transferase-like glycosyltransferase